MGPSLLLLIAVILMVSGGPAWAQDSSSVDLAPFPQLSGPYFGQPRPGPRATPFALPVLAAHPNHYVTAVTFSPDGTEAFWPIVDLQDDYKRWIVTSRMEQGGWTRPRPASFSGKGDDDDVPCLSPDGTTLLFLSRRPLAEESPASKANIWRLRREDNSWSNPIPLPEAVNAPYGIHQQMSLDAEDNLFFAGEGAEGLGSLDLYLSRFDHGEYQAPENLGSPINGPDAEYAPCISPDGSTLIFTRNIDDGWTLFVSFRGPDGSWTPPASLAGVLEGVEELDLSCPWITRDGRSLIFFGERGPVITPYWTDSSCIEALRRNAQRD